MSAELRASPGSRAVWQAGRVVASEAAAERIKAITLAVDRPQVSPPGAHVDVRVLLHGGVRDTRSYSVVRTSPRGELTLGVQLAAESRGGSRFMHDLEVGDELRLTTPLQNFPLAVGASRYVLVAAGIGVTALVSMAYALRRIGADYTFHYAGRSRSAMAFLEEIEASHGELAVIATSGTGHRLNVEAIVENVRDSEFSESTEVYVCGPLRLLSAVQRRWRDVGLPPANLRFETFGSSGWLSSQQFCVRVPSLGLELSVGADQSLLAALEEAGVEVMSDCRKGECGLCALRVLDVDGQIDHRDVYLSGQQAAQSKLMCACVSRAWHPHAGSRVGEDGKEPGRLATVVVDTP